MTCLALVADGRLYKWGGTQQRLLRLPSVWRLMAFDEH